MFTGIVQAIGKVESFVTDKNSARLVVNINSRWMRR